MNAFGFKNRNLLLIIFNLKIPLKLIVDAGKDAKSNHYFARSATKNINIVNFIIQFYCLVSNTTI